MALKTWQAKYVVTAFNPKWKYEKLAGVIQFLRLHSTWSFDIHLFAEDGKEM